MIVGLSLPLLVLSSLCRKRPHLDTGNGSGDGSSVGDTCVSSGERKASEVLGVDNTRSVFDD